MATPTRIDPIALDGTFMTEEEYLALPETTARMELVDGLVSCEPSATFGHQRRLGTLFFALTSWAKSRQPEPTVVGAPLDVRFAAGRILQPDLLVYLDPLVEPVRMPVTRIPDLCVEVVSRRVAYDRTAKRLMYARAGVKELWTVLAKQRLVERWTGPGLEVHEECARTLTSPLLPGFELDVERLFRTE